jgi:hypothetical protein
LDGQKSKSGYFRDQSRPILDGFFSGRKHFFPVVWRRFAVRRQFPVFGDNNGRQGVIPWRPGRFEVR